jgi:hypothetical protein
MLLHTRHFGQKGNVRWEGAEEQWQSSFVALQQTRRHLLEEKHSIRSDN